MTEPLDLTSGTSVVYKAHPDDEGIDRIECVVVPRYKQSELSGDEWRVHVAVRFYRKGTLVGEREAHTMQDATILLPSWWLSRPEISDIPLWKLGAETCHQYGCDKEAAVVVRLEDEFSARGEGPLPKSEWPHETRRAFCLKHQRRGDCGREDSDDNYKSIKVAL